MEREKCETKKNNINKAVEIKYRKQIMTKKFYRKYKFLYII